MPRKVKLAIVGATGAVGQEMLKVLSQSSLNHAQIVALASDQSYGDNVEFGDDELTVLKLSDFDFTNVDLAVFCTPAPISAQFGPKAKDQGAVVLDCSSAFRLKDNCELLASRINAEILSMHKGIIALPDAISLNLSTLLDPIREKVDLKRIVVTACVAVTGVGQSGLQELEKQVGDLLNMREITCSTFKEQIAFNIIPYVGTFVDNDYTDVEHNVAQELSKIWDDEEINCTLTCITVPLFFGHFLTINLETSAKFTAKEARALFVQQDGISVLDNPKANSYKIAA